jgi:hypothetical protein
MLEPVRVLWINDSEWIARAMGRGITRKLLERHLSVTFHYSDYTDEQKTIEEFRQFRPDIVILDRIFHRGRTARDERAGDVLARRLRDAASRIDAFKQPHVIFHTVFAAGHDVLTTTGLIDEVVPVYGEVFSYPESDERSWVKFAHQLNTAETDLWAHLELAVLARRSSADIGPLVLQPAKGTTGLRLLGTDWVLYFRGSKAILSPVSADQPEAYGLDDNEFVLRGRLQIAVLKVLAESANHTVSRKALVFAMNNVREHEPLEPRTDERRLTVTLMNIRTTLKNRTGLTDDQVNEFLPKLRDEGYVLRGDEVACF